MIALGFDAEAAARLSPDENRTSPVCLHRLTQLSTEDHFAWKALSSVASADSIFAAPWFTQSVLAHFDPDQHYRLFVVKGPDGGWDGVMAVARVSHLGRVPFRHMQNQLDANQFLGVPLVRPGHEARYWSVFLDALDQAKLGCNALRLAEIPEDHRVAKALLAVCKQQGRSVELLSSKARACWQPSPDDSQKQLSAKRWRRMASLEKQLAEKHGPMTLQAVQGHLELDSWLSEFLALELAGWKGAKGSALASAGASAQNFRQIAHMGFDAGAFQALALRANGQPIAMTSYFLSGDHAFGFKTAFDESFARFGPGTLLMRALMHMHGGQAGLCFDSCAAPDASLINSLWPARRVINDYIIAIGDWPERSRFVAAAATRRLWHKCKDWKRTAAIASPF
jgi:CelD/BcsL family acetyltransferase involved in cellulose biosynthesis